MYSPVLDTSLPELGVVTSADELLYIGRLVYLPLDISPSGIRRPDGIRVPNAGSHPSSSSSLRLLVGKLR
jgi:hypothetical protein